MVRTVKGCGIPYKTPISPNASTAIAFPRTYVRGKKLCSVVHCVNLRGRKKNVMFEYYDILDHAHQCSE